MSEKGINIDMTPVKSAERYFYVWSHRKNIGTPLDTGSMLMIAEFDPVHPERLISEPKCLSRPLYALKIRSIHLIMKDRMHFITITKFIWPIREAMREDIWRNRYVDGK